MIYPKLNPKYHVSSVKTYKMQWQSRPENLVMLGKFFFVYRLLKESISKEMNNDNDLRWSNTKNIIFLFSNVIRL